MVNEHHKNNTLEIWNHSTENEKRVFIYVHILKVINYDTQKRGQAVSHWLFVNILHHPTGFCLPTCFPSHYDVRIK